MTSPGLQQVHEVDSPVTTLCSLVNVGCGSGRALVAGENESLAFVCIGE